jgi:tRNA nucleotidyltransferase (CCA-adding enzyme)
MLNNLIEPFKSDALFITKTYMDAGYECYIVGGPIRDIMLGLKPKDIDFATNCPLDVTKKLFENVIPTGEQHGTLSINLNDTIYEVTRYRYDVSCDGRNATISFAETFEEDAKRRDFTINSIGYNPITHEIRDPNNGIEDIKKRILKFVGDPSERIKEDNLRSIRFVRFLLKLRIFGFVAPEKDTLSAVNEYNESIVSVERIYQELNAMFEILKVNQSNITDLKEMLDKMAIFKRFGIMNHTKLINSIFTVLDFFPLVVELKGDYSKLKLSRDYKQIYSAYSKYKVYNFNDKTSFKYLLKDTKGDFKMAEFVLNYLIKVDNHKIDLTPFLSLKNMAKNNELEPFMISHLNINGNDLNSLGISGTDAGKTLNYLLEKVIQEPKLNEKKILMELINDNR